MEGALHITADNFLLDITILKNKNSNNKIEATLLDYFKVCNINKIKYPYTIFLMYKNIYMFDYDIRNQDFVYNKSVFEIFQTKFKIDKIDFEILLKDFLETHFSLHNTSISSFYIGPDLN